MSDGYLFVTLAILALVFLYCGLLGGAPERWGLLILATSFGMQVTANMVAPQDFDSLDPVGVIIDIFYLVNFGALALHAKRVWPIWAASLQILSLGAHFARAFDLSISEMTYGVMRIVPTYAALLGMMAGATFHQLMLRRHGTDPSWKTW